MSTKFITPCWWTLPEHSSVMFKSLVPPPAEIQTVIHPITPLSHPFWYKINKPQQKKIIKPAKSTIIKLHKQTTARLPKTRPARKPSKYTRREISRRETFLSKATTVPKTVPTTPSKQEFRIGQKVMHNKSCHPAEIIKTKMVDGQYFAQANFDVGTNHRVTRQSQQWYPCHNFEAMADILSTNRHRNTTQQYGVFSPRTNTDSTSDTDDTDDTDKNRLDL
jgi:hypothetical protein